MQLRSSTTQTQSLAPLRVALTVCGTDAGRSGLGTWVEEVVPRFIERVRREGGEVVAVGRALDLDAYGDALRGARTRRLPAFGSRAGADALWHLTRMVQWARREAADVVLLPAANRRLCASSGGVPTVSVVHDLAELHGARAYHPLRNLYVERVVVPALRRSSRVVAVSGATRRDLIERANVDSDRISVVPNGVDVRRFARPVSSDLRAAMRARHRIEGAYLLYPARLEDPGKNHLRLLRAFARSRALGTHRLVLCGDDWGAAAAIRRLRAELGLQNRVRWLGRVADEMLVPLYAESSGVVMAGLREGFGLPALEALAAGRAVAVSDTGALPEVVDPLGVLFDPHDEVAMGEALDRLVCDRRLARRVARLGARHAARFRWERTVESLYAICDSARSAA